MTTSFPFSVPGFQFAGTGRRVVFQNGKQSSRAAFTLIEIAVSMAIMSFALVGILGLFPVALDTARDSKAETQIGLLARRIESDLRTSQHWQISSGNGSQTLDWSGEVFNSPNLDDVDDPQKYTRITFSCSLNGTASQKAPDAYLAYSLNDDLDLQPKGTPVSATDYSNGQAGAGYLARVRTEYNPAAFPGMVCVLVDLSVPGSVKESDRRTYTFFTLLGRRQ
ncbi:MAG: type II secretion system protein [Candidatus Methylacidiphilales bacterium]|nr:type II secretion system protein [Candidatus Methylacidiphilales bacterium]